MIAQARDLDDAEKFLEQSFKNSLKQIEENTKNTAESAYKLGLAKELNLEYKEALHFFKQAVEYGPENNLYLSALHRVIGIL